MTSNDILRRIRYTFDFSDDNMIALFGMGNKEVTRAQVSDWLKKEEDPAFQPMTDQELAIFLNGLIEHKRGKREGVAAPVPEKRLNNNLILRKLKIALALRNEDMLALFELADKPISPHELSSFFRKHTHSNYRPCQDQYLRAFLNGMQTQFKISST